MVRPRKPDVLEDDFRQRLTLVLGARPDMRLWRQNSGQIKWSDGNGRERFFRAGPPPGAHDVSGIVLPGWRLEIETKGAKTKDRAAQDAFAAMITKFGGVVVRCRYNRKLSMEANLDAAVAQIEKAIEKRRSSAGP